MAEYGVTVTGFVQKTEANIRSDLQAKLRATISPFLKFTGRTFVGNLVDIFSQELAKPWEGLSKCYVGFDADSAVDDQVESLAILNDVPRGGPTRGRALCSVNVDVGFSALAGTMFAHVVGQPENRWYNEKDVPTVTDSDDPNQTQFFFVSETPGKGFVAPVNTLTVIAGSLPGWNAIVNIGDAAPGTDIEDLEVLRLRREQAVAAAGSTTVPGARKDIAEVGGVIQVSIFPDTDAHSVRCVVWDGTVPAADNNAIAQAMLDEGVAGGITTIGEESGIATDEDGTEHVLLFDRATQVPLYAVAVIDGGADVDEIKAAVISKMPIAMGKLANYSKLAAAPLDVAGVEAVNSFTLGTSPAPVGTSNIPADPDEILVLSPGDISVIFA